MSIERSVMSGRGIRVPRGAGVSWALGVEPNETDYIAMDIAVHDRWGTHLESVTGDNQWLGEKGDFVIFAKSTMHATDGEGGIREIPAHATETEHRMLAEASHTILGYVLPTEAYVVESVL